MKKNGKKYLSFKSLLMSAALAFLGIIFQNGRLAESIENSWFDFIAKKQASLLKPSDEILIINIDDKSLMDMETVAGKWPWPRSIHGFVLDGLSHYQPKAIVFDIMFAEKDLFRPKADEYFAEVIASQQNIYLAASEISEGQQVNAFSLGQLKDALNLQATESASESALAKLTLPWIIPQSHWRVGSITFETDYDGIGRRYDVRRNLNGWLWMSLPALVAKDMGAVLPEQNQIRLRWLGEALVPFENVSYSDLFFHLEQPDAKDFGDLFQNKIIIIGSSATGLYDSRPTALSSHYPGVSMLATALDNLLMQRYYREAPVGFSPTMTFLLVFMVSLIAISTAKYRSLFTILWPTILLVSGSLLYASWLLASLGLLWPIAYTLVALTISLMTISLVRGFNEYMQRQKLIGLFSRFIDPRVVRNLLDNQQLEISTQSKSCMVTVLFSDIRGFTSLSESRSAEDVVSLLNNYFSQQVETIFKYGGTLDKFIGDAIMAFWGAPVDDNLQADNALKAALEMTENLKQFRQNLPQELQGFDVGIGLHTGIAVVGMIGSEKRYDYTAIGDTVNLASRIEGLTKDKARILLSEDCLQQCQQKYHWIEMGSFQVKGRKEPVKLYSLEGGEL